jgi:hypothetical protein
MITELPGMVAALGGVDLIVSPNPLMIGRHARQHAGAPTVAGNATSVQAEACF